MDRFPDGEYRYTVDMIFFLSLSSLRQFFSFFPRNSVTMEEVPKQAEVSEERRLSSFINDPGSKRMVAVRYFLDRPGYDLQNSSVRFWYVTK
jgi:hypothetical protein